MKRLVAPQRYVDGEHHVAQARVAMHGLEQGAGRRRRISPNDAISRAQVRARAPRIELDWDRVYRGGFRNRLRGPSSLGLFAKGGYGRGTSTIDGGFELHKVSGPAVTVGADLNLANITVFCNTLGIELYAYRSIIYSSQANFGVESLGLMTVVRR
jgi:hypothetical protein